MPFPPPGDLPDPGIEPRSPGLEADALPSEPPGKPKQMTLTKVLLSVSSGHPIPQYQAHRNCSPTTDRAWLNRDELCSFKTFCPRAGALVDPVSSPERGGQPIPLPEGTQSVCSGRAGVGEAVSQRVWKLRWSLQALE